MALRDTDIAVDIIAESDPLREINNRINDVTRNAMAMNTTINTVGGQVVRNYRRMSDSTNWMMMSTRGMSQEALEMKREMTDAFYEQRRALQPFRNDMMKSQYDFFKLSQSAKDYQGTASEFMAEVQKLGKAHKKVMDDMMAANEMQKFSFIQSVGMMLSRSTQASKIADNFDRMGNPLYRVNNGLLNVADNLNKIAMGGQPAAMALKLLGPTANMKQLNDMTMMIQQGMMRFTMVGVIALAGAAIFYNGMHKMAMDTNKAYATAFSGMVSSVRKAIQPMVDAFAAIMTPVYNFIKMIADMVIRFNEANPTLAKFIGAFFVLIPLLTLLLSPLAIGIGLFGGLQVAMAAVWPIIGPIVTGFAAMMGTVLLVTAVIVGLAAAFIYLWRNSETFRNGIIAVWNSIKSAALAVFNFLRPYIMQAIGAVTTFVQQKLSQMQQFWNQHGTMIISALQNLWSFIKMVMAGIGAALVFIWPVVQSIIVGTWNAIKNVINGAIQIIMGIIRAFSALFTGNWSQLWASIKQILMGALQLAWGLINLYFIGRLLGPLRAFGSMAGGIIRGAWAMIKGVFMAGVSGIRNLVMMYFNFYRTIITGAMNGIMAIIRSIWSVIRSVFTGALSAIRSIVTSVFNGVRAVVTSVMNTIRSIITSVWNAARSAVTSAVNGIRSIVTSVFNALRGVVSTAMNNVKSAIVNGWNAAKSFLQSINLTSIGKNIIQGLVSGITSAMGAVKKAVSGLADMIPGWLKKKMGIHSPARVMIPLGGFATEGVAVGMQDQMKLVERASRDIAMTVQQPVAGITPETSSSSSTTNNSSNRTINFNPTIQVNGSGSGSGGDVRGQVREAMDEAFAHLLDLYDPEVAY